MGNQSRANDRLIISRGGQSTYNRRKNYSLDMGNFKNIGVYEETLDTRHNNSILNPYEGE